jgi:hypothetical protein
MSVVPRCFVPESDEDDAANVIGYHKSVRLVVIAIARLSETLQRSH